MADGHGSLDILSEHDWRNLVCQTHERSAEIAGANLNVLLKGLFSLFSKSKQISLPLHNEQWEEIIEPTFMCLNQICSVEEIMLRINELCSLSQQFKLETTITLFHGAIWFLWFWVHQFSCFISSRERILLHVHLVGLRSVLNVSGATWVESWVSNQIERIIFKLEKNTFSVQSTIELLEPNFALREGCWDGSTVLTSKQKTEVLKTELSKMPKLKLEIFGADLLFDDDEEDDDDNSPELEKHDHPIQSNPVYLPYPVSRIRKGENLLKGIDNILSVDTVELARQWTLVDHGLFCSISLFDLLIGCFSPTSSCHEYSDKLFENIRLSGLKKLVDRFNAASLWVTEMVLKGETPKVRAEIITKFIQLASQMQKMGNYNGLMVILTALQQGSVSRLAISFDLLEKEDVAALNSLKRLMAGAKNYASYREELLKISLNLPVEKLEEAEGWRQHLIQQVFEEDKGLLSTQTTEQIVEAVVPHLAAHLGALTGITECLSDYLSENVHLMNLTKWKLCANVLTPLFRLQKLKYHFRPLRSVICSLHSQWKVYYYESSFESKDVAKRLYAISEANESPEAIYAHFHKEELPSVKEYDEESVDGDALNPVNKTSKIRAYDRITKLQNLDTLGDLNRPAMSRSQSQFSVLKRMFSRRKVESSDSESEEDSSSNERDEDTRDNDDVSEDQVESVIASSQRSNKGRNLFRSISKFLYR